MSHNNDLNADFTTVKVAIGGKRMTCLGLSSEHGVVKVENIYDLFFYILNLMLYLDTILTI